MNYKNIFLILAVSFFSLVSCQQDDFDNKVVSNSKGKIVLISGNNQSGVYDEYLNNTILFKISPENEQTKFYLAYSFLNEYGYGSIVGENVFSFILPDENNMVEFKWKLGNFPEKQDIKFFLFADSVTIEQPYSHIIYHTVPCDSVTITANPIKPKGWVRAYFEQHNYYNFDFSSICSYDNETLYATVYNSGLFSSKDGGNSWFPVKTVPYWTDVRNIRFNSKGWMYVQTDNNGIFYSKDLENWESINNGILDYRDPTSFYVDDDVLMTSFYFDGPYLSTNNGQFWEKLLIGGYSQRFYHTTRHKGDTLYLFDDWGSFFKSENKGDSWISINIDSYTGHNTPNDFKVGKDGSLYIGTYDAQLSVISSITYTGDIYRYYEWNGSTQYVENITVTDDDIYYLVTHAPKAGLYSKNNEWNKIDLNFKKPIQNYYIREDGTFILISYEGIYYFNE